MGRQEAPLGDLGNEKTWVPPRGEQGISNRANDEGGDPDNDAVRDDEGRIPESGRGGPRDDIPEQTDYVAGGDKSNRAAQSGATGERHPGGGANKPEPKNQDEKAGAGRRNDTDRNR